MIKSCIRNIPLLVLSVCLAVVPLQAAGNQRETNGHDWRDRMSSGQRTTYILGFLDAATAASSSMRSSGFTEKSQPLKFWLEEFPFSDSFTISDVVAEVDELYNDPRNRPISLWVVVSYAAHALSGLPADLVEKGLNAQRQYLAKNPE